MGKKSAILVGCGYYGTQYLRYGCEKDVRMIEEVLIRLGFRQENIKKMIQPNPLTPVLPFQPSNWPTSCNLRNELDRIKREAGVGDVLFFYFSGLVMVNPPSPAIFCSDGVSISATDFQSLANQLPDKTSFTLILESSHSAGFINPVAPDDKSILFSACRANETAKRVVPDGDHANAYGVFTNAIRGVLDDYPPPTTRITIEELLKEVSARIECYDQHPCLCRNDKKSECNYQHPCHCCNGKKWGCYYQHPSHCCNDKKSECYYQHPCNDKKSEWYDQHQCHCCNDKKSECYDQHPCNDKKSECCVQDPCHCCDDKKSECSDQHPCNDKKSECSDQHPCHCCDEKKSECYYQHPCNDKKSECYDQHPCNDKKSECYHQHPCLNAPFLSFLGTDKE